MNSFEHSFDHEPSYEELQNVLYIAGLWAHRIITEYPDNDLKDAGHIEINPEKDTDENYELLSVYNYDTEGIIIDYHNVNQADLNISMTTRYIIEGLDDSFTLRTTGPQPEVPDTFTMGLPDDAYDRSVEARETFLEDALRTASTEETIEFANRMETGVFNNIIEVDFDVDLVVSDFQMEHADFMDRQQNPSLTEDIDSVDE